MKLILWLNVFKVYLSGGQLLITFFIDLLLHPVVWQLFLFCYFVFLIYSYFYFVIIIHLYLLCLFLLHLEFLVWALDWAAVKNYLFFNFFFSFFHLCATFTLNVCLTFCPFLLSKRYFWLDKHLSHFRLKRNN